MTTYEHYEILGLNKNNNPNQRDIKKAYHELAMKNHPDKNPDNKECVELFKKISNAYSILSDEKKKQQYDQFGDNYEEGNHMNEMNAEDIFSHLFGARGGFNRHSFGDNNPFGNFGFNFDIRHENKKCGNIIKTITTSLDDVYNGIDNIIKINMKKYCFKCRIKCPQCDGKGYIKQLRSMGILQTITEGPCPQCKGKGELIKGKKECSECKGDGIYHKEHTANLKVEAGYPNNYKTVFKGLGEQPKTLNQEAGDLIIQISVEENKLLKRIDNDLYYKYKISFIDSIIGKDIEIPYFNNKIKLNTSEFGVLLNKKEYIIEGKGLPIYNKNNLKKGNMILEIEIDKCKIKKRDKIEDLKNLLIEILE